MFCYNEAIRGAIYENNTDNIKYKVKLKINEKQWQDNAKFVFSWKNIFLDNYEPNILNLNIKTENVKIKNWSINNSVPCYIYASFYSIASFYLISQKHPRGTSCLFLKDLMDAILKLSLPGVKISEIK